MVSEYGSVMQIIWESETLCTLHMVSPTMTSAGASVSSKWLPDKVSLVPPAVLPLEGQTLNTSVIISNFLLKW